MPRAALAWCLFALAAAARAAAQAPAQEPSAAPDGLEPSATGCIEHLRPHSKPDFPRLARQWGVRGRIVALVHFDAADRPPVVELFHRPTVHVLRGAVEDWAEGLRRPCHERARFSTQYPYRSAVALGEGARCPLRVRWQYLQPYRANRVQVLGAAQPGHGPIIERLARLELALTKVAADSAWGDTTTIDVPCHTSQNSHKE